MKPTLLDTGGIVGLLDRSEAFHHRCVRALEGLEGPLVTCEAVIAESCYRLRHLPGAAETVLENVERGIFQIPFQLSRAALSVRAVMRKYRDLPADFADACLIQLADELNTGDILTLDQDFESYRWRKARPFRLLVTLHCLAADRRQQGGARPELCCGIRSAGGVWGPAAHHNLCPRGFPGAGFLPVRTVVLAKMDFPGDRESTSFPPLSVASQPTCRTRGRWPAVPLHPPAPLPFKQRKVTLADADSPSELACLSSPKSRRCSGRE